MLINAGTLLETIRSFRICYITGRFGSGKTLLAVKLAYEFKKQWGYRILTNIACELNDNPDDGLRHCVIVLDEGGIWITSGIQVKFMLAYPAKLDQILIIPSYYPPAKAARIITIQPFINFMSSGLPVVLYTVKLRLGDQSDKTWFLWVGTNEMYGVYSRDDPGADAGEFVDRMMREAEAYRVEHGYKSVNQDYSNKTENLVVEALEVLSESLDNQGRIKYGKSKK